jgi:hypothetical protein
MKKEKVSARTRFFGYLLLSIMVLTALLIVATPPSISSLPIYKSAFHILSVLVGVVFIPFILSWRSDFQGAG